MPIRWSWILLFLLGFFSKNCIANLPPIFTQDMNNLVLSESTPLNTIVYNLEGFDPEGGAVTFGIIGSNNFIVNSRTGEVKIIKSLDRESQETLSFLVSIKDKVNEEESDNDNLVTVPITVIVSDENDNAPEFLNLPYETEVFEDALIDTTIFKNILVTDTDTVGENLDIICLPQSENPDDCSKFLLQIVESNQDRLTASVILKEKLDYNERMIYQIQLAATDGMHTTIAGLEIHVKDVQNTAPVFQGSLASVISEDSPIGTLVMTIQARDGDRGQPRKIYYELLTNPMDYFLLDSKTGELKTAKPLDKEALPDATGLIILTVRAREIIDSVFGNDDLTSTTTQASVTIVDVNDSPPTFNQKEYNVTLTENTALGTPLPLDMNVYDPDVGQNAEFSLRLDDVSGVFAVEPTYVVGSSQVSIRVANGSLDFENPNQRKFIVLVIAEETKTFPKLSSTATLTVSIIDSNDNKPIFDQDTYSATISETAPFRQVITTITAKDMDSGLFGDQGIRYSLSGTGSELFDLDPISGVISVANCVNNLHERKTRQILNAFQILNNSLPESPVGVLAIESDSVNKSEYVIYKTEDMDDENMDITKISQIKNTSGGKAPCLDFETQSVYFLSYKATDDEGKGQASVVSLRITLMDANDSPPVCESQSIIKATLDEGAIVFEPSLFIKARDPDIVSDINYKIIGSDLINQLFVVDKRSGQLHVAKDAILDVNHLKSENVYFDVEASDGLFSTLCKVNITIRDVNNHPPTFSRENYMSSVEENAAVGTIIEELNATDLDTGVNAEIRYRMQQGSFDDFSIDNKTGTIVISRKLDFDRRNTYQIQVLASDMGTPSLTGTTTVTVNILNSNDKAPYFTPTTQRAEIAEDSEIGVVVHTLIALDPDVASADALVYAQTEPITAVDKDGKEVSNTEDFKDMFLIDKTGKVILNKMLNRDLFAVVRITVLVTDTTAPFIQQGKGLLVITIIDVNEKPPIFSSSNYNLQVLEEQPIGTVLTTLQATDADSNVGEYSITDNKYFEINNVTGTIKSKTRIDFESVKKINLNAIVTDTGIPQLTSTAEIMIDVININDNDPIFNAEEYHFEILENSPRGTILGKIEAIDADDGIFGEIKYSIVGEESTLFLIEAETGIITVNTDDLDREKRMEIIITAVASDKAPITLRRSSTVSVYIHILDVNDNSPIFTKKTYNASVAENAAGTAAIIQVVATDKDEGVAGTVRYFIQSGNNNETFELDSITGILHPAKSLLGTMGKYVIFITASDENGAGPHTDYAEIIVTVQGINQNRPIFIIPALSNASIEIIEDIIVPDYLVMTVKASDKDLEDNGRISYYLQVNNENRQETNDFKIDEVSGELKVKHSLNRKDKARYELILVARDHGLPTQFETLRFLTILVVDVNENIPEFPEASNPYRFSVTENEGRDVRVGKIQAILADKDIVIYYYILLGNEKGFFYIDKTNGDIYTNGSLDRESIDNFNLYILASKKGDVHISDEDRLSYVISDLANDKMVAKVWITVLDLNDNPPIFEKEEYFAGINSKASLNELITIIKATDKDLGPNAVFEYTITASNLYKYGSGNTTTGSIVPSPFAISGDGRLTAASYMAEYNQDRFILDIQAKELAQPERNSNTRVYIWIFNPEQLIRIILSRPPSEVHQERQEIISELSNVTQKRIVVDGIRYHIDAMGRIREEWSDLYFHAVDTETQAISPVDSILNVIDTHYDFLKDYYTGVAIENIVPAHAIYKEDEFDLALAALIALLIVLFVGAISFIVLCCCLKHWVIRIPMETRRKDALIKKQIVEDLNTTENPLWIEQKLKLYEEQELTMQVFSEPENLNKSLEDSPVIDTLSRTDSYEKTSQTDDNTYATIQPRDIHQMGDVSDYATLRTNDSSRAPSIYEFTGSTFQVQQRERPDYVAELI